MATTWFSTNTDLGLVNALTQSLTLYLPLNSPQGKNIFVKDATGNSFRSTISVRTQGVDTFEDGSLIQTLNSAYESIQLNYSANKWYITGGTMFNTMSVSTIRTQAISTISISSLTTSFSTLTMIDQRFQSTLGNINSISSLLFYNSTIVSAGLRYAPSQVLNRYTFSPIHVASLFSWFDGKDPLGTGTPPSNGTSMSVWVDKSSSKNNAIQNTLANQPIYNSSGYLTFNGTNNWLSLTNSTFLANSYFTIFIVEQRQSTGNNNFFIGSTVGGINLSLNLGYYPNQNSMDLSLYGNDLIYGSVPSYVPGNEPFRIWSFVFNNSGKTIYLNSSNVIGPNANQNFLINNASCEIGASRVSALYYNGNINEVIFCRPNLALGQQQEIEGYLAWKWGLQASLSASNPFKNAPP